MAQSLKNLALAAVLVVAADQLIDSLTFSVLCWLAVTVWMAITEGWLQGLLAAVLACLALYPQHPPLAACSLLVAGALYCGGLADGIRRRIRMLRETVALQAQEMVRLRERERVLEWGNDSLKASISERQGGLAALYEIFRRLAGNDEAAIVDVVRDFVKAEQCSLYRLEGRHLRLAVQRGWPSVTEEVLELGDDLLSQAVLDKELRTLRDFPLERLSGRDPGFLRLMAAPILHPGTGQCLGAISVESLPFASFTKPTAELLQTIADLAGRSLAAEAPTPEHEWLGPDHFVRRLRTELLAVERGTRPPFGLLWIAAPSWSNLSVEHRHLAERALSLLLAANLRGTDVRGRVHEGVLGVMLLETSPEQAQALTRELMADCVEFLGRWLPELAGTQLEVGVTSSEGSEEGGELLARARGAVRPCVL